MLYSLLRLASRRIPPEHRTDELAGWWSDLYMTLYGVEGKPIPRLWRGLSFSLGLLVAAPSIAHAFGRTTYPPRRIAPAIRRWVRFMRHSPLTCSVFALSFSAVAGLANLDRLALGIPLLFCWAAALVERESPERGPR